jgi:phospholipid/cholesterol/gamma-HCH transport system substrate-binding protein
MKKKAQRIRLGIFITVSGFLLLVIFGWFTGRGLFEPKDTYFIAYRDISVTGLEVGSPVKYLGINVGSVRNISIDPQDFTTIVFELTIDPETPVKEDAVADIIAVGITGMKAIEIRGGSAEAGFLKPESYIEAGSTIATDITGRAEVIAFKIEEVLNNLQVFTHPVNLENYTRAAENISVMAANSNTTVQRFNEMITENREDIRQTAISLNHISGNLEFASADFASSMERFNEIMQGEDIAEVLGNIREISLSLREANLQELIGNLSEAARYTQGLLATLETDFEASSSQLSENLILLQYTLENLNDATRKISLDPSVLVRGQSIRNTPDRNLKGN